jgi:two-component system, NtrC family, response regulator AtoC
MEKEAIERALAKLGGNRTKAAEELGISRRTILNKIKKYGL